MMADEYRIVPCARARTNESVCGSAGIILRPVRACARARSTLPADRLRTSSEKNCPTFKDVGVGNFSAARLTTLK